MQYPLLLNLPLIHHVLDNFLSCRDERALVRSRSLESKAVYRDHCVHTRNAQPTLLLSGDLRVREEPTRRGYEPRTPLYLNIEEQIITCIGYCLRADFASLS